MLEPTNEIVHKYHEPDLGKVMSDVFSKHPEDTFMFLNEGGLRERIGLFRDHFLPDDPRAVVAFAMKANPHQRVMNILAEEGVNHFDSASPNEIQQVLDTQDGAQILYNNPFKRCVDIRTAAELGVRHYTAQVQFEVDKIMAEATTILPEELLEIAIRLRTINPRAKVDFSKLGAIEEDVIRMLQFLKSETTVAPGISVHTGSQNTDMNMYKKAIEQMAAIARKVGGINSMNVGGGFPANYGKPDEFNIKAYLELITETIKRNISGVFSSKDDNKIIVEPGRSIVAETMDLVIPVLWAEEGEDGNCVRINDGVYTSFGSAKLHNFPITFRTLRKDGDVMKEFSPKRNVVYSVFGRTCDGAGDYLGKIPLPSGLQVGDYLACSTAGAYSDACASTFNGFGKPKYVSYNI